MRVVLAGAFGHLGRDILKELVKQGHEVIALDAMEREVELQGSGRFTFHKIDCRKPETMAGLCDGADVVITTMGLTKASKELSCYDIDLKGNQNLLEEAKRGGAKKFIYISVIHADSHPEIPMLDAKAKMENLVKESGIPYIIYRPTGYFYDIVHVLKPMVEKGAIRLLGKTSGVANVIATEDFAEYIVSHFGEENRTISIGGKETYTYTYRNNNGRQRQMGQGSRRAARNGAQCRNAGDEKDSYRIVKSGRKVPDCLRILYRKLETQHRRGEWHFQSYCKVREFRT